MKNKNNYSLIITILFAILILILSIVPTDINGETPSFYFKGMDKLIHLLMYGTLSFLVLNVYLKKRTLRLLPVIVLLSLTAAYSVLMEIIQYYFVVYRSGDYKDVIANFTGVFTGFLIILLWRKIKA